MISCVAMDFYVGPAVLTFNDVTFGVTAFIDSAGARGEYVWGGFLDPHWDGVYLNLRIRDVARLALPGQISEGIDVLYISPRGVAFLGSGPSPLGIPEHCD